MKHIYCPEIEGFEATALGLEGAKKMTVKLLSEDSVWIELEPEGHTPGHTHGDKERMLVVSGKGELQTEKEHRQIKPGDFLEFDGDEYHQIINTNNEIMTLICFRNQK